ncbi:MAG: hypothetical protein OHK0022_08480 [Roseiflexaceae bacterium]
MGLETVWERIESILRDTLAAINRLYPETLGHGQAVQKEPALPELVVRIQTEGMPVFASRAGCLQAVDADALLAVASEQDLVIQVLPVPGDWVTAGDALVCVWPVAPA